MASPSDIKITVFGKTDVGLIREHNEDTFLIADVAQNLHTNDLKTPIEIALGPKGALFMVCDGMGGAAAGEVASQMAIELIVANLEAAEPMARDPFARRLRRSIEDANDKIYAQSRDNQSERGMGTTCTAAALVDGTLVIGQIGDSRCYVVRNSHLGQVTKDQSLAWQLIEAGAMTPEEAKQFEHANIILQALGVQERVEVVLSQVALRRGDVILISSDGLHGPVSDEDIGRILAEEKDIQKACDRLVSRALERDGPDNVTVVLARFDGEGLPEATADDVVAFVPYDPGRDAADMRRTMPSLDKVTAEMVVPQPVIGLPVSAEAALTAPAPAPTSATAPPSSEGRSEGRSLLAFVFVTLVAAAAAAVFIKWDRGRTMEREQSERPAAAAQVTAPPPQTSPAPTLPAQEEPVTPQGSSPPPVLDEHPVQPAAEEPSTGAPTSPR